MNNIFILQSWLANKLADSINYHKEESFNGDDLISQIGDFKITKDDFNELSYSDAKNLGFKKWSDDEPELLLIPAYLWRFIPSGLKLKSINGEYEEYDTFEDLDNDRRFGCLAYGIEFKN